MKISEEIIRSFFINNKNIMENERALKALRYFISQNVLNIFGQDEVGKESGIDLEKERINENVQLLVSYFGEKYKICCDEQKITFKNNLDRNLAFVSFCNEGKIENTTIKITEENTQISVQVIGVSGQKDCYDSIRQIFDNSTLDYTIAGYRLKPINAKVNEKEYVELSSLYEEEPKSFLEKIVSLTSKGNIKYIHTTYEMADILDYLPQIFAILEEKCDEELAFTRKR